MFDLQFGWRIDPSEHCVVLISGFSRIRTQVCGYNVLVFS
jgi:hypothetical protein